MSFPQKVHHILSQNEFGQWITWMPHGRAFRVIVPVAFEKHISEKYFGHKRYSSFLRQLSNHNFKHISQGVDRNCYYHECMLRGYPNLCQYMPRPKEARRLISDPENEPNFYEISQRYPLVDDPMFGHGVLEEDQGLNQGGLEGEKDSNEPQVDETRSSTQAGWMNESSAKPLLLEQNQLPTQNLRPGAIEYHNQFLSFNPMLLSFHQQQQHQQQLQPMFASQNNQASVPNLFPMGVVINQGIPQTLPAQFQFVNNNNPTAPMLQQSLHMNQELLQRQQQEQQQQQEQSTTELQQQQEQGQQQGFPSQQNPQNFPDFNGGMF